MAKKKSIEIGYGHECPKCGLAMKRRVHKEIGEKQLQQPYYFIEWDYRKPCKHIQLYEQYKIHNKTK